MPCLIKTKSGIYYAIFHYQGKQVWRSTYSRDREEAMHVMEELSKEFPKWRHVTILRFRDQLLDVLKGQNAQATIALYDLSLRELVKVIGNKFLRAVTAYDIELFKSKRLQEVTPVTVAIHFRCLKASFSRAVRFGIIKKSPFEGVKNVVLPDQESAYLTRTDLMAVLNVTTDPQIRAIIVIAICTSMRLGEIINLLWSQNIDLERGFIHLKNRPDFILKAKRNRIVPLNVTAMRVLAGLERRSDYVFCDATGKRLRGEYVSKHFKQSVRLAGLSERIHFHSLRHSGISLLVQMAVPLPFIQRIAGHSNIRVTSGYTHGSTQDLQESVMRLDPLFKDAT